MYLEQMCKIIVGPLPLNALAAATRTGAATPARPETLGAKLAQRMDPNDAGHQRQRRKALVSAKALPRRSGFRQLRSVAHVPGRPGESGLWDPGGTHVEPWSPPGVSPRRSFGSFPIAGKGTRPAGRNPFRHPTAGTREGRPLIRHGMRRDTFPPRGEGFGENGTPPDRGTGLCRRACFTEKLLSLREESG